MGQVIPRQHPAVVLKSHYKAVRALLAAALIAVVALAAAVVILANDDSPQVSSKANAQQQVLPAGTRFDGGPDEGTRGLQSQSQAYWQQANPRTSYQPTPDEGFKARAGGGKTIIPQGPGAR